MASYTKGYESTPPAEANAPEPSPTDDTYYPIGAKAKATKAKWTGVPALGTAKNPEGDGE